LGPEEKRPQIIWGRSGKRHGTRSGRLASESGLGSVFWGYTTVWNTEEGRSRNPRGYDVRRGELRMVRTDLNSPAAFLDVSIRYMCCILIHIPRRSLECGDWSPLLDSWGLRPCIPNS